MQIGRIQSTSLTMALLGALSGLICAFAPEMFMELKIFDTPIFHGLLFGAVIGFGQIRWGDGNKIGLLIIMLSTTIAWVAAVNIFQMISPEAKAYIYPASITAGIVGAVGTLFGAMVSNQVFRNLKLWLLTVLVGAITGMLVIMEADLSNGDFLVLFVVWQSAIAFCFGLALNDGPLAVTE